MWALYLQPRAPAGVEHFSCLHRPLPSRVIFEIRCPTAIGPWQNAHVPGYLAWNPLLLVKVATASLLEPGRQWDRGIGAAYRVLTRCGTV